MRINAHTTPSTQEIDFGYKHLVNGFVHKQISQEHSGTNDLHDTLSLYSVSNLDGGYHNSTGNLAFPKGASFFVSCYDTALAKLFVQNIMTQPELFAGMKISDISIQNTPDFPETMRFSVASPVLVKKFDGTVICHLTFDNPEANEVMTKTMQTKLRTAGLDAHAETVRVRFDTSYAGAKTKLVDIHGIKNRANVCPVIIEGTPEAVAFAWDVGVGHSTGAGFGAVREFM